MLSNGKWAKTPCIDNLAFQWIDCDDTVTMDHAYNKRAQEFQLPN